MVDPKNSFLYGKDTSLRVKALGHKKRELLTISCLLIAAKFNEKDAEVLRISHLQKETKKDFSYRTIVQCEAMILQELNWNIMMQTSYHYFKFFTSCGVWYWTDQFQIGGSKISFKNENKENLQDVQALVKNLNEQCDYFINLSIHDYFMLQFREEVIAMAAIVCARKITKITPEYSENFKKENSSKRIFPTLFTCSGGFGVQMIPF